MTRLVPPLAALLILGACAARPGAAPVSPPTLDNGTLWSRTSAEYEALCRAVYVQASGALALDTGTGGEACSARPRAVVMDLDETVLDNSLFNVWIERDGVAPAAVGSHWDYWVRHHDGTTRLVPGALAFIEGARAAGVTPVFISNRDETTRAETIATLRRLGVIAPDATDAALADTLLLKTRTSGKDERRARAAERFCVIALVGDNLADFASAYERGRPGTGADRRALAAGPDAGRWGVRWFVLPNPMYGDWRGKLTEEEIAAIRGEAPAPMGR